MMAENSGLVRQETFLSGTQVVEQSVLDEALEVARHGSAADAQQVGQLLLGHRRIGIEPCR